MSENNSNKTIAKNTMFLYLRMMFTMLVALYTSRVILQKLGVTDYGIYQSVGGMVGFLSFINNALSTGSSRFLTFELGKGNGDKLKRTFSTVLTVHLLLALIIVIIAETIGLWFVSNKLVIPQERLNAAIIAYHISVFASVFSLTQVPYNASIISHEKMSVYAYVSIYEVSMKLLICYLIGINEWDKLILYAVLIFFVNVSIMIFYRFYCNSHFKETKYSFILDKKIFKNVASFSGWSLFANGSIALNSEGVILLLNMFFSPAVVAARAISIQVNMAANQFVSNFRTAVNPQIVKKYASEDYEGSKRLLLSSTKYSYYLMFIISLPVFFLATPLLHLWLGHVPPYTDIFLQLIIIQSLFQVFDTSFFSALYAKGQLRENALISPTLGFLCFPIIYVMFKFDFSPVSLSWAMLIMYALLGLVIKPLLLIKIVDYTWKDIFSVFIPCLRVTLLSVPIPTIIYIYRDKLFSNQIIQLLVITFVCIFCISLMVWFFGIDKEHKNKIVVFVSYRLRGK